MNLKNIVLAFLFVISAQFFLLQMQMTRLTTSTRISAQKLHILENRLDLVETGDAHVLEMEESVAILTQGVNSLRQSNQYLLEHAGQTDEKFEVMEQFRTRMETSADVLM